MQDLFVGVFGSEEKILARIPTNVESTDDYPDQHPVMDLTNQQWKIENYRSEFLGINWEKAIPR